MAQLVAHLHGMQGVRGSNPLSSTKSVLLKPWSPYVFVPAADMVTLLALAGFNSYDGPTNGSIKV